MSIYDYPKVDDFSEVHVPFSACVSSAAYRERERDGRYGIINIGS
jgi:hypothetical protein